MTARLLLGASLLLTLPGPVPGWTLHVAAVFSDREGTVRSLTRGLTAANRDLLRDVNVSLALVPLPFGDAANYSRGTVDSAVRELCAAMESRRILALLVVGAQPTAVAMALAAGAAGLPVLWARNDSNATFYHQHLSPLEVTLDPDASDVVVALRSLLFTAHWHTFTVIADETAGPSHIQAGLAATSPASSGKQHYKISDSKTPSHSRAHLPTNTHASSDNRYLKHSRSHTLTPNNVLLLRSDSDPRLVLSRLQRHSRGVVVLTCTGLAAQRVLDTASSLQMLSSDWIWIIVEGDNVIVNTSGLPLGLLSLKPRTLKLYNNKQITFKSVIRIIAKVIIKAVNERWFLHENWSNVKPNCWGKPINQNQIKFASKFTRSLKAEVKAAKAGNSNDAELAPLHATFDLMNLARVTESSVGWRRVGLISGPHVRLDTIVWPGGDVVGPSPGGRAVFRVVTALAPPFVMAARPQHGRCLRGLKCHRGPPDQTSAEGSNDTTCCYGFSMDLLQKISQDLSFEFQLYIVSDGFYGSRRWRPRRNNATWTGIVGDLMNGHAHMSFAALSVSSTRSKVIEFSAPFYFGGISMLAAPAQKNEIPLLAFLLPFSPELWIAIFTSLNVTAIAVAIYEWLSPFGLNPWGRKRSKNFSIASALWVMWGLLCGHLVAFKAPKSWPNKFLINVWGGFSVIFVASYTANIAALIAGHFFQNQASYTDRSLMSQRVGTARSSIAEFYVQTSNPQLWQHMRAFSLPDVEQGVNRLRNGSLDVLVGDSAVLDYYRAMDPGCKLERFGEPLHQDMYAVGLARGFPLRDSISTLISQYSTNGYLDILQHKWYAGLPCFSLDTEMVQPRPLGVAAVAGVFLLLALGMVAGICILIMEHIFYKRYLPGLRRKPKGTIWRSRNLMFFSQKLYRFINCVELVSPHHAARELVRTLRKGHITSLFQKSVKRKEHEQRRRRKSKSQFFEMIQEIRRVQAEERDQVLTPSVTSPSDVASSSDAPLKSPADFGIIGDRLIGRKLCNAVTDLKTIKIDHKKPQQIGNAVSEQIVEHKPDTNVEEFKEEHQTVNTVKERVKLGNATIDRELARQLGMAAAERAKARQMGKVAEISREAGNVAPESEEDESSLRRFGRFRQESAEQQVPSIYGARKRRGNFRISTPASTEDAAPPAPPTPPCFESTTSEVAPSETRWQARELELTDQLVQSLSEKEELLERIRMLEKRTREPP